MKVDVIPTLIDQYRETFEGEVRKGMCWITDCRSDSGLLGTIEGLSPEEAFAPPAPGGKSIASHVAHVRFTLAVTLERLNGANPSPDWPASFNVPAASPEAWESLKRDLRKAYEAVLAFLQQRADAAPQDWPPIHLVGLAGVTAHNAYHLGAIRQMAKVVRREG